MAIDVVRILAPQECTQLSLRTVRSAYILLSMIHGSHSQYPDIFIVAQASIPHPMSTTGTHIHKG